MDPTTVHVVRHGQVHNPDGILYGRQPGFGLSDLGREMAERLGEYFAAVPLSLLRSSPLQRARETMAPIAERHPDLEVGIDPRVIEAANTFEGSRFGTDNKVLFQPSSWWHFRNPLRPSWGEPYPEIAQRMLDAIKDAAAAVPAGGQALIVSHQLPIFIARRAGQGRSFVHDPRRRETHLASVTSFLISGNEIVDVEYAQPARDLVPQGSAKKFRVGT